MEVAVVKRWSNLLFVHLIVLVGTVAMAGNILAAEDPFNYITPEKTKLRIESGEAVTLLDIQIEDEYARHHIRGSLATYAYPVKSDAQKAKLDRVIPNPPVVDQSLLFLLNIPGQKRRVVKGIV